MLRKNFAPLLIIGTLLASTPERAVAFDQDTAKTFVRATAGIGAMSSLVYSTYSFYHALKGTLKIRNTRSTLSEDQQFDLEDQRDEYMKHGLLAFAVSLLAGSFAATDNFVSLVKIDLAKFVELAINSFAKSRS